MELQFFFNGTLINHPDNWREFESVVERSADLLGLVNKYSSELTFSGDAYEKITDSIANNGFCQPVTTLVQIRESSAAPWKDLIEGIIFPTECDFDRTNCTVKTQINDNSYISKIQNNQKIKAHIDVPRSKNDVSITAATSKVGDWFTPSTGLYDFPDRISYSVDETLRFLVDFMTDGTVDYISSVFGSGGDYEYWHIIPGRQLRVGVGDVTNPYVSFYDVLREINKKTPIGFGIEDNGGTPRIRIEKREYFRNEAVTGFIARDIRGLQMTFRETEIYSKVRFGGTITQKEDGVYGWPDIPFLGFKEEEYHLLGECNIDNELELVGDWIVDSNVIEDILINDNDDYDEDIVLFVGETSGLEIAPKAYATFDFTGGGARVYNYPLTNQEVAKNYLGFIPNSIAQYLGVSGGVTGFSAQRQTLTLHTLNAGTPAYNEEPAEYNTVLFNDGNYIATPKYTYTAPVVGYYNFTTTILVRIFSITSGTLLVIRQLAKRFNSAAVLQETISKQNLGFSVAGFQNKFNFSMVMNTGDYVLIRYELEVVVGGPGGEVQFGIESGLSYFNSLWVVGLGGIVQEYDPTAFHIYNFKCNYPMSLDAWEGIAANPARAFKLNGGTDTANDIITFADRIVYKPFSGMIELNTFSKYNGF